MRKKNTHIGKKRERDNPFDNRRVIVACVCVTATNAHPYRYVVRISAGLCGCLCALKIQMMMVHQNRFSNFAICRHKRQQ